MRQSQQTPDTTTVRPHTWSQSSTPCKLKTNLIHKSQSNIKDQDSVQQWLIKQELIIPSKQVTAAILTMALLYISSSKYDQKELINGSRAVTICLENLHLPPNSEVIVAKVASMVEVKLIGLDNQIQQVLTHNSPQSNVDHPIDQRSLPPINSKDQATEYFATCGAFSPDTPTDLNNITCFLLQLSTTNNLSSAIKNGIRASAFLIKNTNNTNTTNSITNWIKQQLNDITRQFTTKTNTLHNLVQDITHMATTVKDNALKTTTHLKQPGPVTYAAVAQTATNQEHADIIARGLNANKQLLIVADKTIPSLPPSDLTEKDLVTKANMALKLMDDPSTNKPTLVSFIFTT